MKRTALTLISTMILFMNLAQSVPVLADSNRPQEYLALGDSQAFGFDPLVINSGNAGNPNNFIGYPDTVAIALKENLTNASCPGETSSHFISLTGTDIACRAYRSNFPLHVAYNTSQLDFADAFLQSHLETLVVSINIGINDLLVLIDECGGADTPDEINCILSGLPAMLATLSANLDTIYGHIRNLDGYNHKLVALTYYSLDYSDPLSTGAISQVNQVIAERTLAWGGVVADGFGAFAAASVASGGDTCAAGLRIVLSTSPLICDEHPSPAGRDLLAQAIMNALRPDGD